MDTPEDQKALICLWAEGANFLYNDDNQPKAEFSRLAKVKGWVGGEATWCMRWEACFGETYSYTGQTQTTLKMTRLSTKSEQVLMDSMRRLSLSSDASSYSFISEGSTSLSVVSLDTNGSVVGGVVLAKSPKSSISRTKTKKKQTHPRIIRTDGISGSVIATGDDHEEKAHPPESSTSAERPECSPFWKQFPGFTPVPTATFKDEFARLAKHQGWSTKMKRAEQNVALTAEIRYHYGTCLTKLDRWQELCEETGIENIPTSITKCKKALQNVFVNLFNLIDHRRNPNVKIIRFQSYGDFCRHVRAGNKFPRNCAKEDGFINALLKRI
ncbi:hypothetical protein ACN47E_005758 [Coniothyrium glycines]